MIRLTILFLIGTLIIPVVSLGDQISIPLPELRGHYVANGSGSKTTNLYCGIQFTEIQSVQVVCQGQAISGTMRDVNDGEIYPLHGEFYFLAIAFFIVGIAPVIDIFVSALFILNRKIKCLILKRTSLRPFLMIH